MTKFKKGDEVYVIYYDTIPPTEPHSCRKLVQIIMKDRVFRASHYSVGSFYTLSPQKFPDGPYKGKRWRPVTSDDTTFKTLKEAKAALIAEHTKRLKVWQKRLETCSEQLEIREIEANIKKVEQLKEVELYPKLKQFSGRKDV